MTELEWKECCVKIRESMEKETEKFITPLSKTIIDNEIQQLQHIGTGTYIKFNNKPYIITNDHVIKKSPSLINIRHQPYAGIRDTCLIRNDTLTFKSKTFDLALLPINDDDFIEPQEPIDESFIAHNPHIEDKELLFVLGYPGAKSRFTAFEGGQLISGAVSFLTSKEELPSEYDPEVFFALKYPYDQNITMDLLKSGKLPDPGGLSGSAVWNTYYREYNNNGKKWTLDETRMIGLLCKWDQPTHTLIGIKIDLIRYFLFRFQQKISYQNWENRGKKIGDDWNDWFNYIK